MTTGVVGVLLAGGSVGVGLLVVVRALRPGVPALAPALRALQAPVPGGSAGDDGAVGWPAVAAGRRWWPDRELALLGYTPHRYLVEQAGFALVGVLFPPVMSLILTLSGVHLGVLAPAGAGLLLAAVFVGLVQVSVRQRAAVLREEFARHVAVYLDLIALELAASRGPAEALERAAAVGGGWVPRRIRYALHDARLRLRTPWEGLRQVAEEIGVPDLADVGDIMTLAWDEGAQVYDSLRSRAASLRAGLLARDEDRATTATTVLYVPTSLLVFVLFVFAAYPFLLRLITT